MRWKESRARKANKGSERGIFKNKGVGFSELVGMIEIDAL